jgi:N-acetylglucosamine malate deacetylase 1
MNVKTILKQIYKFVPASWLAGIQFIHSSLVVQWILRSGSKPIEYSQKSAMVFSPHQDDETLGCGGMIALKRQHGIPVCVTFITDGGASGLSDPMQKDKITGIRKQEALTALGILGVEPEEIHFLEKPDGGLYGLQNEQWQETIEQIAELLKSHNPLEVYLPHRKDCHKDHEATYELVKAAIALSGIEVEILEYPIWLFWSAPLFIKLQLCDLAAAYRLPLDGVQDKKNQAIASYFSQLNCLPNGFIDRFLGSYEIFFKVES